MSKKNCTQEQLNTIRRINGNRNWVAGRLRNGVETLRGVTRDLSMPADLRYEAAVAANLAEAALHNYQKFIRENPATAESTAPPKFNEVLKSTEYLEE